MKQEISPWSIYDKKFTQKPTSKHDDKISKTIDYSRQTDKVYDEDLLENSSSQIKNERFRRNADLKPNKIEMHTEVQQKFNTLTHQKITAQKHLLGERNKEIIMLRIIRQQLYKEQRQDNQKKIVHNIIQFKDPTPEHFQFPKIGKNNQSVLLVPEAIKKYQIKRYKSRMDSELISRNNQALQFNDDKILEKNPQLVKSRSKPKKLAHLLLYLH